MKTTPAFRTWLTKTNRLDPYGVEQKGIQDLLKMVDDLPEPRSLGDVEGHPFHGNQWTDGNPAVIGNLDKRVFPATAPKPEEQALLDKWRPLTSQARLVPNAKYAVGTGQPTHFIREHTMYEIGFVSGVINHGMASKAEHWTPAEWDQAHTDWVKKQGVFAEHIDPRLLGGPGSGNFSHAGRPGEVGGSSTDGGGSTNPTLPQSDMQPWMDKGGWEHSGVVWKQPVDANGRPIPIPVKTVEEAIPLVLDGKVVDLPDIKSAHTLIGRLGEIAQESSVAGDKAKNYDLCHVSVAGTNLFCAEYVTHDPAFPDGRARVQMPQINGKPIEGSEAAKLPVDQYGKVYAAPYFESYLAGTGITTRDELVPASELKASQRELVGTHVADIMNDPHFDPTSSPIYVSSDHYIIDGHHRWAATIGRDAADGALTDKISVTRVNMKIAEVLHLATAWADNFGIAQSEGLKKQTANTGLHH